LTEETYDLHGHSLLVESETYMGLRLTGPAALVDAIKSKIDNR
jgi:hypothetical protein